jgi:hypothetical protein
MVLASQESQVRYKSSPDAIQTKFRPRSKQVQAGFTPNRIARAFASSTAALFR